MAFKGAWVGVLLAVSICATAGAEIFVHREDSGTIVYSDRSNATPAAARSAWKPDSSRLQRFSRTVDSPGPVENRHLARRAGADATLPRAGTQSHGPVDRVRFERSGGLMLVDVRLNDRVVAPFYIDSGCTDVSITPEVAAELGLDQGPITGRVETHTGNGIVLLNEVRVGSVAIGRSRISDLAVTINPHLPMGLLGASFLNEFVYSIDPISNVLTLERRKS